MGFKPRRATAPSATLQTLLDFQMYFSTRLDVDTVTILREVVLVATSNYRYETKERLGTEGALRWIIEGLIEGGSKSHVPVETFLAVTKLPAEAQRELVRWVNTTAWRR